MSTVYCKTCTRKIMDWTIVGGVAVRLSSGADIPLASLTEPRPIVVDGHRLMLSASPSLTIEQLGCPGSGSVGRSPALGEALRSILDDAPRLDGIVTLARSRSEWYVATPWSGAVTGPSPLVVVNQAFAHKTLSDPRCGGWVYLPLLRRLRWYETMQAERREGGLVRVTVKTALAGKSAWSSDFAPGATSFDAETLDRVAVDLLDQLYPPMLEADDVKRVAAKMASHGLVDEYLGELVNDWVYRWASRRRRLVGDQDNPAFVLGSILNVAPTVVRSMLDPRRPAIYPCGCSMAKVDIGRCDTFRPGQRP